MCNARLVSVRDSWSITDHTDGLNGVKLVPGAVVFSTAFACGGDFPSGPSSNTCCCCDEGREGKKWEESCKLHFEGLLCGYKGKVRRIRRSIDLDIGSWNW